MREHNELPNNLVASLPTNLQFITQSLNIEECSRFYMFYRANKLSVSCKYMGYTLTATAPTMDEAISMLTQMIEKARVIYNRFCITNQNKHLPKGAFVAFAKQELSPMRVAWNNEKVN